MICSPLSTCLSDGVSRLVTASKIVSMGWGWVFYRLAQKIGQKPCFLESGREFRVNTKIEGFALSKPSSPTFQVFLKSFNLL